MKTLITEFKKFAMRGNVIDMAVGIVIGGAFGKIVNSLVTDIVMPPIGLILNRVDFSNLFVNLSGHDYPTIAAAQAAGAPTLNYGLFINSLISFIIVAFALFLVIKQINRLRGEEDKKPKTVKCPHCQSAISPKAARCPFCTSRLETKEEK